MSVLLLFHSLVTIAMIGVILLQKSEGGGMGLGGGGGNSGLGNVFTARGTANLLTRTTAILATIFMVDCLVMAYISNKVTTSQTSILTN